MERLVYIDLMRFLAIFFVTGFHVARSLGFENLDGFGYIFKNLFIPAVGWVVAFSFAFPVIVWQKDTTKVKIILLT